MPVNRQFDGDVTVAGMIYPQGGIQGFVQEAPLDLKYYVRRDGTWYELNYSFIAGTPPGLADAPNDGQTYGRSGGSWIDLELFQWTTALEAEDIAKEQDIAWALVRNVSTEHSLTGGGNLGMDLTLSLVGDSDSPGNSKYYGTNGSGTKGWHALPAGGGGSPPITKKTADYTATDSDGTIICTPSADMTITLPVSSVTDGRIFSVVRTGGTGNVAVVQSGGSTLRTINTVGGAGGWVWCATDSTYYPISYVAGS